MMSDAEQLVEQIAAEADASAGQSMPPGTVWSKPGKTVTVATRVSPEHLAAIEELASRLDVPMSARLRGWILAVSLRRRTSLCRSQSNASRTRGRGRTGQPTHADRSAVRPEPPPTS